MYIMKQVVTSNYTFVGGMQTKIEQLKKRRSNFIELRADGDISPKEYQKYCEGGLHRRFVKKYWKPIVIKIAVC